MSDDEEAPAYVRAHRAKLGLDVSDIDGGAIAAGSIFVLAGFGVTIVVPTLGQIGAIVVALGLVAGGYVAARLAMSRPIVHGLGVASLLIVVVFFVSLSAAIAETEQATVVVTSPDPSVNIVGMLLAIVLSGIGSYLGRNE